MTAQLLEARKIVKTFPGVRALDEVDFDLRSGEVHALLGENGAGKSTLVNVLTGVHRPDHGEVRIDGREVTIDSPHEAREHAIRVIHQELAFVPQLDVATNLSLGEIPIRKGWFSRVVGGVVDRDELERRAAAALALIGNPVDPDTRGADISVAQAQLLEITRALSSQFRILLLDEPTSSLSPSERDDLFHQLRSLKGRGIGIVYISHRLEEVVEIADRVTVLRDGRVVATLDPTEITVDRIIELMTGLAKREIGHRRAEHGETALELHGLTRAPAFRDVNLVVRSGEIVGVTGLIGAGRTELARCIFGVDQTDSGEVRLRGERVQPRSARDALNLGIAYGTEDRKGEGIFPWRPIRDNIALGPLARADVARRIAGCGQLIRAERVSALVRNAIRKLAIRPPDPDVLAGTISGGNQQKVVLARLIESGADVLLLDEPTRGIDVGSKQEIWKLIKELVDRGVAVLVISSEVPELLTHADRLVVMRQGQIVAEMSAESTTEAEVMRIAGGAS